MKTGFASGGKPSNSVNPHGSISIHVYSIFIAQNHVTLWEFPDRRHFSWEAACGNENKLRFFRKTQLSWGDSEKVWWHTVLAESHQSQKFKIWGWDLSWDFYMLVAPKPEQLSTLDSVSPSRDLIFDWITNLLGWIEPRQSSIRSFSVKFTDLRYYIHQPSKPRISNRRSLQWWTILDFGGITEVNNQWNMDQKGAKGFNIGRKPELSKIFTVWRY